MPEETFRQVPLRPIHAHDDQWALGWKADARCRGVDPAVLYVDEDDVAGLAAAKELCAACPVRDDCLEHAIASREKIGVWGGMTPRERQRVIRRRRREAA